MCLQRACFGLHDYTFCTLDSLLLLLDINSGEYLKDVSSVILDKHFYRENDPFSTIEYYS